MWYWAAAIVTIAIAAAPILSQGIATGNAPAASRAKFSGLPFRAKFTDIARAAGVTARFVQGNPTRKQYIIEANGTGVALVDYDGDRLLDIFLVNGTRFEPSAEKATNRLYRNTGGGKFADVTAAAGVGRSGWGNGVCGGDIDNDGDEDLYVTYWGLNSLYRNNGRGRFEDIAATARVAGTGADWSTGCTFVDYDRDGLLDLFVATYAGFDPKRTPRPGSQPNCIFKDAPVYCGPRGLPFGRAMLYRNRGDATFDDVTVASGIGKAAGFYAFTAAAADLNGDGWTDIYVASDSTPSLYFRNNRDGTFTELATEAGIAYNEHGAEQAGMGLAVGDADNDGWLDIVKTNFIRDYPNLYRNIGKGIFEDTAVARGLGVNPQYVLWGTALEDLDNDGWKDIFQVAGHVYADIESIDPSEPYRNPRLVYRNLGGGKFEDVSHLAGAAIADKHSSRGAAFGDLDNDGDVDAVIMNMDEPPSVLRNNLAPDNAWVSVQVRGTTSNRSGIGASVTVEAGGRVQTAPVLSQSSYLSRNDARLHFGLGAAKTIDRVTVRWPGGVAEAFRDIRPREFVTLVEGKGEQP